MLIKGLCKFIVIVSLIAFLPFADAHAQQKQPPIRIALLPCSDLMMAYKKFYAVVAYLKKQTDLDMKLVVFKDMDDVGRALKNGDIDFVFQDPQIYVHFDRFFRKDSLLASLNKSGASVQQAAFIVRKKSGIKDLKSLRGKSVMFGLELSAPKWVAARALLEENGIRIDKDLKSYSHGSCCDDIAFNVSMGAVDAGVVCAHFLDEHYQQQKEIGIDRKELVVIGRTKPVPSKIFCAHKNVPAQVVAKVNQALLGLDRRNAGHADVMAPAELGGFKKARDTDYDVVRSSAKRFSAK